MIEKFIGQIKPPTIFTDNRRHRFMILRFFCTTDFYYPYEKIIIVVSNKVQTLLGIFLHVLILHHPCGIVAC